MHHIILLSLPSLSSRDITLYFYTLQGVGARRVCVEYLSVREKKKVLEMQWRFSDRLARTCRVVMFFLLTLFQGCEFSLSIVLWSIFFSMDLLFYQIVLYKDPTNIRQWYSLVENLSYCQLFRSLKISKRHLKILHILHAHIQQQLAFRDRLQAHRR